ncbi:MAG: transketolase [Candidatus Dojkabacteria bacterium]
MQKIESILELEKKAKEMRLEVMRMLKEAGSGHAAGPLGLADLFTALYFNVLDHEQDVVLVSNGHVCPIWYAVLAHTGYFPVEDLASLRKLGSHLQGHPKNIATPGVFNSSGPLGHSEGQAIGAAFAKRYDKDNSRVFCFLSDGGQQEGAVWEAMLVAAKYKLANLTFILDWNDVQIDGHVTEIMPLPDLEAVYADCGWEVTTIDGNDMPEVLQAYEQTSPEMSEKPKLILAKTLSGKGVSFMEGKYEYHDWKASEEDADNAIRELSNE